MEKLAHLWRKFWGWQPMYWLRCHTFTRYHIIDIRNDYAEPYKWGWIDRDRALLLANFKILVEFMEQEEPGKIIDWSTTPEHRHAWKEMNDLYLWWKIERKQEQDALDKILDDLPRRPFSSMFEEIEHEGYKAYRYVPEAPEIQQVYEVHRQQEELLRKKDQDNLHRLIDIRGHLWT